MAVKQTAKQVFVEGRGGGRGLPKTDAEIMAEESETMESIFPAQEGLMANDCGAKPIFATDDEGGFHRGRGEGRGHGPDREGSQPKNA